MNASFINGPSGRLFCLTRDPVGMRQGHPAVLIVPAFAEEQNKSRALVADLSRALCSIGLSTIQFDLSGTGDSEGDFSEATWEIWKSDVLAVSDWARGSGYDIQAMLGVRLGACLCTDFIATSGIAPRTLVFVQPVTNPALFVKQFLRLRVANSMVSGSHPETVSGLLEEAESGKTLSVAGYDLNPELISALRSVKFADAAAHKVKNVLWFEVTRSSDSDEVSTASKAVLDRLVNAGVSVTALAAPGEPFWTATEIVRNQPLVSAIATAAAGTLPS